MHKYKCASCGKIFLTETHAERCPNCSCRVLVHIEGDKPKAKVAPTPSCCENCSCGCGGH